MPFSNRGAVAQFNNVAVFRWLSLEKNNRKLEVKTVEINAEEQ